MIYVYIYNILFDHESRWQWIYIKRKGWYEFRTANYGNEKICFSCHVLIHCVNLTLSKY